MVLEFLLDMEYFKKRKKKKSHDAIVPYLLTVQHQKITLRQLIVSSGGRENFNSIDLFLTCFQTFLISRAISVTLEGSQQSFCLTYISISENSIINRFYLFSLLVKILLENKRLLDLMY